MKRIVVFLLAMLAGATSATAIEKRIVGGTLCDKERFYHVQVEGTNGGETCGGALLNTRWVLTAAHCGGRKVTVKLGLHNDMSFKDSAKSAWKGIKGFFTGSKNPKVQEINVNQQFVFEEEGNKHDIMLIKLNEGVSDKIPSISLPPKDACTKPGDGKEVRVGGWGAKRAVLIKKKTEKSPRCAVSIIATCDENDHKAQGYHADESNSMCAFKPGVEVCPGDAGSAMELDGKLQGVIVSKPMDECANMIRILDICHYREWIDTTMRK